MTSDERERHYFDARTGAPVDCLPPTRGPFIAAQGGYRAVAATEVGMAAAMTDRARWLQVRGFMREDGCLTIR